MSDENGKFNPDLSDDQWDQLKSVIEAHWHGVREYTEYPAVTREVTTWKPPRFLWCAQQKFLFGWCLRFLSTSRNDRGGWSVQMRWVKEPRHVWTLDTSKAQWTAYPAYPRMSLWTSLRMLWLLAWSRKV